MVIHVFALLHYSSDLASSPRRLSMHALKRLWSPRTRLVLTNLEPCKLVAAVHLLFLPSQTSGEVDCFLCHMALDHCPHLSGVKVHVGVLIIAIAMAQYF